MNKYISLLLLVLFVSGMQAISIGRISNSSQENAYLVAYTTRFTGQSLGKHGEYLQPQELSLSKSFRAEEEPIYKVDAAYVLTRRAETGRINIPEATSHLLSQQ